MGRPQNRNKKLSALSCQLSVSLAEPSDNKAVDESYCSAMSPID